jgi:hypothetical protein
MSGIDQRKLNLYKWMLEKGKIQYNEIPENYRSQINPPQEQSEE